MGNTIDRQYDVFISYSHVDKEWVKGWLVPRLTAANLTVYTDEESFEIGVPTLVNVENAIVASHYILLVMTPAWVADEWTRFAALLIRHTDPAGKDQRALPILRQDCKIPAHIAMLTYIDLISNDEAELAKLIKTIQNRHRHQTSARSSPAASFRDRLAALGFQQDPFAFPEAEKMPPESLEDTFVAHPGFDDHVLDLDRSAVLLASPGGGKTAGRLRLQMRLQQSRQNVLGGPLGGQSMAETALVVNYRNFESVIAQLPNITLKEHEMSLLAAIADAVYTFIKKAPDRFVTLDTQMRDWWWAFFDTYLQGTNLVYHSQPSALAADRQRPVQRPEPFRPNTSPTKKLDAIQSQLAGLSIHSIFILVDEIDGYIGQMTEQLAAVIAPLLNTLPMLSAPGMIWKFFLPSTLEQAVRNSAGCTTGRLKLVLITWDSVSLRKFLHSRLVWASDAQCQDLAQLCDQKLVGLVDIDQELVEMALHHPSFGPPRALLDWGGLLLRMMKEERLSLNDWKEFKKQTQQSP